MGTGIGMEMGTETGYITTHISRSIWRAETPPWRRWPNLSRCKHSCQHPPCAAPPRYANWNRFDGHACHTQSDDLEWSARKANA